MKDAQHHEEVGKLKERIKQLEKELKAKDKEILAFQQLSANMISGADVVPPVEEQKKKVQVRAKKHKKGLERTSYILRPRSAMPSREVGKG